MLYNCANFKNFKKGRQLAFLGKNNLCEANHLFGPN